MNPTAKVSGGGGKATGMTEAEWETATWVAGAVALLALLAVPLACWATLHGRSRATLLAAAAAAARRDDAAARLGDQDDLVQTLVVATYALQLGDHDRARDAVDGALRRSRVTLDQLLAEAGRSALTNQVPTASPASSRASPSGDDPPGPRQRPRPHRHSRGNSHRNAA